MEETAEGEECEEECDVPLVTLMVDKIMVTAVVPGLGIEALVAGIATEATAEEDMEEVKSAGAGCCAVS